METGNPSHVKFVLMQNKNGENFFVLVYFVTFLLFFTFLPLFLCHCAFAGKASEEMK